MTVERVSAEDGFVACCLRRAAVQSVLNPSGEGHKE
jgi:hypothetical protein